MYFHVCLCVQTDMCILERKAPACQDDGSRMRWIKLKLVEVQGEKRIFKEKKKRTLSEWREEGDVTYREGLGRHWLRQGRSFQLSQRRAHP